MKKINQVQAAKIQMVKKYAYVSECCDSVWGEGDSPAEALTDALAHIRDGNNGPIMREDTDGAGGEHEATDAELTEGLELRQRGPRSQA